MYTIVDSVGEFRERHVFVTMGAVLVAGSENSIRMSTTVFSARRSTLDAYSPAHYFFPQWAGAGSNMTEQAVAGANVHVNASGAAN